MRVQYRQTRRALLQTEKVLQTEVEKRQEAQSEVTRATARLRELEPNVAKLQKWTKKEPEIMHYLNVFGEMSE